MGILRFLLACVVVIAHSHDHTSDSMLPAGVSVETFFIISGFYMSLVLDTKYHANLKAFWLNRWFRIAPIYYIIFFASLAIYMAASLWVHHPVDRLNYFITALHYHSYGAVAAATIPQFTIFGIEWPLLLTYTPGHGLAWIGATTEQPNTILLERFLFVPQAWSVGVELLFYVMVPFLNRLSSRTLSLIALSSFALKIALRILLNGGGLSKYDHVTLATQLCLFILGMLVCRHRKVLVALLPKMILPALLLVWLGLFFRMGLLPFNPTETLYLLFTAFILPSIFNVTKTLSWDRWIGNLSYPIYLCHIAIRWLLLGTHASVYQSCSP
jgi:peptidoglycan/LPS O-acetylase OafA/YrhL